MAAGEALRTEEIINDTATEADAKRERSTIEFPYLDLDDAVEVAQSVFGVGGNNCLIAQLAGHLRVVANGGGFRLRLLTAKVFGLLTYDRSAVTLSAIGQKVCDQRQEASGRADAFLNVPLYAKIYEEFKGKTLPANTGLENAIVVFGVAPKQKVKARQVFYRSAQQAGFFAHGNDRLVMPTVRGNDGAAPPRHELSTPKVDKKTGGGSGSGCAGGGEYHPLIEGLIKTLPPAEAEWPLEARKRWLQAASHNFNLIYMDSEGTGSLRIEIEKDSAR